MSTTKIIFWTVALVITAALLAVLSPWPETQIQRISVSIGLLAFAFGTLGSVYFYVRAREKREEAEALEAAAAA
ncbi:MAG: hypothetical protein AAFN43_04805, partial [Pseudomonadota bacterium]